MLNLNSPTVQAMLNNTPQGFGNINIPTYYGNMPTINNQQTPIQQSVGVQTPFPSPKEMLMKSGENTIYNPTSFAPRNIVGSYNPGYQTAFYGYSNPYIGYGYYPNFGYNNYYMQVPPDEDSRDRLEAAINKGLTYGEQLELESKVLKEISNVVSKNLGRSNEEAREYEKMYDIYDKYPKQEQLKRKKHKLMSVKIMIGEKIISESKPVQTNFINYNSDYYRNALYADQMKYMQERRNIDRINTQIQLYNSAPERIFDKYSLLDFFNVGAGVLLADDLMRKMYIQSTHRISQIYDHDKFKNELLKNNGVRTKEESKAVEKFVGRYGIMPDGRPVSPGHDPAIAESFSYNPNTGQYSITAPNFLQDRIEKARESFIRTLDNTN